MTRYAILMLGLALPLAACGGPQVNEENASVAEVSEKVAEASRNNEFIRPGKWLSSVTIEEMSMPGMPPQAAEQMKRMIAETQTSESCLTPDQAKQPKEEFFSGNDSCRYDHFRMGNGRIDAKMRCQTGGNSQLMEMNGTYSPDSYQMRMKTSGEAGGGRSMTMKMKVDAKRIGECTRDKA